MPEALACDILHRLERRVGQDLPPVLAPRLHGLLAFSKFEKLDRRGVLGPVLVPIACLAGLQLDLLPKVAAEAFELKSIGEDQKR